MYPIPKNWCIRGCTQLRDYQQNELGGNSNCHLGYEDCYYYNRTIDLDAKRWNYSRDILPDGYTEISFEDFEKYILNKDSDFEEVIEPEDLSYLAEMLKELNIK